MDEASDEEHGSADREAGIRADRFWALGYREGWDHGKEAVLEASFQKGYALGVETGRVLGRAQGVLTLLQAVQGKLQGPQALSAQDLASQEPLLTPGSTDMICRALLQQASNEGQPAVDGQQAQSATAGLQHLQERARTLTDGLVRVQQSADAHRS